MRATFRNSFQRFHIEDGAFRFLKVILEIAKRPDGGRHKAFDNFAKAFPGAFVRFENGDRTFI